MVIDASPERLGMPRYFFTIVQGNYILDDEEGTDLPDLETVRSEAVESAREIMANDIRSGEPLKIAQYGSATKAGKQS